MIEFLKHAYVQRRLLLTLTKRDLTSAYNGSVAGNLWVVVDPLVYVALTLVFFQFAIRGVNTGGVPYVVWVLPVLVFWTFVNVVVASSVNSVREYGYLLRHRSFDMRLVALIKIMSASSVHFMLMAVVLTVMVFFLDVHVSWRTLSLCYYFFAMCCLLIAISWLLSALGMFWKDIRNLVSMSLQVGFWISPIFWEPDRFPPPIALIMYLNPFYYPLHGYRQSILSSDFGSHFMVMTLYFWVVVALGLLGSSRVFQRLSRSFGDVI